jgi:hypothetical protein
MSNSAMFKQQQQQQSQTTSNTNTLKSSQFNNINSSIRLSEQEAAKKKALSMDSINAVERELDEVLKDLELNSQDLNDQLNGNQTDSGPFNSNNGHLFHNHQNGGNKLVIELPITIQKSVNTQSPSSSPSMNNHRQMHLRPASTNTVVTKTPVHFAGLYIDDSEDYVIKSQEPDLNNNSNGNRKQQRANIVSTYELCHECQDGEGHSKACKSKHSNVASDFASSGPSPSSSLYNHLMNSSPATNRNNNTHHSNQDLSKNGAFGNGHFANNGASEIFHLNVNNRSRSVLAQINEVAENGSGSPSQNSSTNNGKHHQSFSYLRSNSNNVGTSNRFNGSSNGGNNGNVISQKIVSIGMPAAAAGANVATNGSPRTQSPSPKLADFKSTLLL